MSYLLRVTLPDEPGSLALLGAAIGDVGGNIHSVDVVEAFPDGTVMDDLVVGLPSPMPDTLITAAQSLPGVQVQSILPFSGRVDRRGQIQLLATVATMGDSPRKALEKLVEDMPRALTSSWMMVLRNRGDHLEVLAASSSAPETAATIPLGEDLDTARVLDPETEKWIPELWALLDSSLAVAPLPHTRSVMVIGRVGGPEFLDSEIQHVGYLATIVDHMLS